MPSSIKCFRRFFKATWHPQQMDNPSSFETGKTAGLSFNANDTELGEVKIIATTTTTTTTTTPISIATSNSTSTASAGSVVVACGNGGCNKTSRIQQDQPRHQESPWHRLKTIFLISVIVALIVWVLVYTLLSQYKIL